MACRSVGSISSPVLTLKGGQDNCLIISEFWRIVAAVLNALQPRSSELIPLSSYSGTKWAVPTDVASYLAVIHGLESKPPANLRQVISMFDRGSIAHVNSGKGHQRCSIRRRSIERLVDLTFVQSDGWMGMAAIAERTP